MPVVHDGSDRLLILSFATIQSFYFYSGICKCNISLQKGWLAHYQVSNTKLIISLNKDLDFNTEQKEALQSFVNVLALSALYGQVLVIYV